MTSKSSFVAAEFAWKGGDRPGNLDFTFVVPEATSCILLAAIPESVLTPADRNGARLRALGEPDGIIGRYRLETNGLHAFLRVTARRGNPELERALVDHLASSGVPVNALLACGVPVVCPRDGSILRMDVRPLLMSARHFSGAQSDLEVLGRTLSAAHGALAGFPRAAEVESASHDRAQVLRRLSADFARSPLTAAAGLGPYQAWIAENADWCGRMADEVPPEILFDAADRQCVHGEPHQGNVLFADDTAILLDFEEAVNLYVSTRWDVAFAVQRFALDDEPKEMEFRARCAALERGYGSAVLDCEAMRCVAWTTLMILFDLWHRYQIRSPISECEKFRRHENLASALIRSK